MCCIYTTAKCRLFLMKYYLVKSSNVIQRFFKLGSLGVYINIWENILKYGSIFTCIDMLDTFRQ